MKRPKIVVIIAVASVRLLQPFASAQAEICELRRIALLIQDRSQPARPCPGGRDLGSDPVA